MDAIRVAALLTSFVACPGDQADGIAFNEQITVFAPTQRLADDILDRASKLRVQTANDWLDAPLSPDEGTVTIRVIDSETASKARTSRIVNSGRTYFLMWITAPREDVFSFLPHEMCHVILGARFGDDLPAWVDEAIACLQENSGWQANRRQTLKSAINNGTWPEARVLLNANHIPPSDRVTYAFVTSLAEFLLEQGDKKTLLNFASCGKRVGWDTAASRYYEFKDLNALEFAWRRSVPNGSGTARTPQAVAASANRTTGAPKSSPGTDPTPARIQVQVRRLLVQ
jgi:hypothetical protein